jgi:cell wall-associated NlpC family hydrolase
MILRKGLYLVFCFAFLSVAAVAQQNEQTRPRVVKQTSSQPINQPQNTQTKPNTNPNQRPTLTNKIVVVGQSNQQPLVQKTGSTQPVTAVTNNTSVNSGRLFYSSIFNQNLYSAIQSKIGIPYRYGSEGPNSYDCSSFVWKVFEMAGISITRSSARNYYQIFEPVSGDERYKFGTLVFFNRLGHVGIVADANGFYHASSSKGITYSKFAGYWEKRVVGFRKIPSDYIK